MSRVQNLVAKLGSQVLSDGKGRLDEAFLATIATQVAALCARGLRVTLVSSGAIAAGLGELELASRPTDLAKLQAVAAVGQRKLMDAWAAAFSAHALPVAQVLLTRDDIDDRSRYLNLRNTITAIHELQAVPIINENDTVSTDELVRITFGDNDILAALVARALDANLLVLLSVVEGLLDDQGAPVRLVQSLDDVKSLVRDEKSVLGKGGMNSKIEAARMLIDAGEAMVLANGRAPNILGRTLAGEAVGTLFVGRGKRLSSRSRWIGSVQPAGTIVVDAGAAKALMQDHRSLLPAGIVSVEGLFAAGDVVAIVDAQRKVIAQGLCNYASRELGLVRGKKTAKVRALLGDAVYEEVVHRDNLVLY